MGMASTSGFENRTPTNPGRVPAPLAADATRLPFNGNGSAPFQLRAKATRPEVFEGLWAPFDVRQALRRPNSKRICETRGATEPLGIGSENPPAGWEELKVEPLPPLKGRGPATRIPKTGAPAGKEALAPIPPQPGWTIKGQQRQTIATAPAVASGSWSFVEGGGLGRETGKRRRQDAGSWA